MAVRTETPMNLLADAIIVKLRTISKRKDAAYLTTPKSVERSLALGDFAGKGKPILALSISAWEGNPVGASRLDGNLSIVVHCMTENTGGAEAELLRLVSDVILCLLSDVTLGSQAIYLFPRSFEPNVDLISRTGLAVTSITFDCLYRFDTTNP